MVCNARYLEVVIGISIQANRTGMVALPYIIMDKVAPLLGRNKIRGPAIRLTQR